MLTKETFTKEHDRIEEIKILFQGEINECKNLGCDIERANLCQVHRMVFDLLYFYGNQQKQKREAVEGLMKEAKCNWVEGCPNNCRELDILKCWESHPEFIVIGGVSLEKHFEGVLEVKK